MLVAITRSPGPELTRCELTHLGREPIDFARALEQHRAYQAALRTAGAQVVELRADPEHPDGVFVEDTAIVLEETAIITCPAPRSRRGETAAIESALRPFRPIARLPEGAFLEGGDVLRMGHTLFVGLSSRTGEPGLRALAALVTPLGYRIVPVRVTGCLHLKSACCALSDETVLVNREWVDIASFDGLRLIDLPAEEPWGANVLRLPAAVAMSTAHPRTIELVRALGFSTLPLDVSELHKAESGLTCMSLIFDEKGLISHRSR